MTSETVSLIALSFMGRSPPTLRLKLVSGGKERVEGWGFSQRVKQLGERRGRVKGKTSVRGRANGMREGWSEGVELD